MLEDLKIGAVINDNDLQELALLKKLDDSEFLSKIGSEGVSEEAALEKIMKISKDVGAYMYLARVGGVAVGYIIGQNDYYGGYRIDGIYVLPEYRRKGVAKKLCSDFFESVKSKKVVRIYSNISQENTPAIELVRKVGFAISPSLGGYSISFEVKKFND